jgi:hypothetical protein
MNNYKVQTAIRKAKETVIHRIETEMEFLFDNVGVYAEVYAAKSREAYDWTITEIEVYEDEEKVRLSMEERTNIGLWIASHVTVEHDYDHDADNNEGDEINFRESSHRND